MAQQKLSRGFSSILVILFILFGLSILILAVFLTQKPQIYKSKASNISYTSVGKGLIYYTENYKNKFSRSLPPVANSQIASFETNYIKGVDCSRFLDLTDRELNYFDDLKLNFVILGFGPASWYNIAPKRPTNPANYNDPGYNFSNLDKWIGKVQNHNLQVVLQLWGTPTWSSGQKTPDTTNNCSNNTYADFWPYNSPPVNLNDFADFAQAVVTRYDGTKIKNPFNQSLYLKVNIFSLWNEPNNAQGKDFWNGTTNQFVQMNNSAYSKIKSYRPDVSVWGPNLLGNYSDPEGFLRSTGGQLLFDVFSVHTYPRNFQADPTDSSNQTLFAAGNIQNIFSKLDSYPSYFDKPIAITEVGYRSNWENQFNLGQTIDINEKKKGQFLNSSLDVINRANTQGRIIAVANNTLYNSWRWWSSGLINYSDPETQQITYSDKLPAYDTFKDWRLSRSPSNPNLNTQIKNVDASYLDSQNKLILITTSSGWQLTPDSVKLQQVTLNLNGVSGVFPQVPNSWIDTAYTDNKGNYTVVKGDRYWYQQANSSNWYTNTLESAYRSSPNFATIKPPVPTKDIDTSYWDNTGALTVIKRNRYWYRSTPNSSWYSNTLKSAYYLSPNAAEIKVPTESIDSSFFDRNNRLVVIKGSKYWLRSNNTANWQTGSLIDLHL